MDYNYKVFATVGQSSQSIDYTENPQAPPGMIEMNYERPLEGDWIAAEDGTWISLVTVDETAINNGIARKQRELNRLADTDPQAALKELINQ